MAEVAPYGSWRSPIGPAVVARGGRRLGGAKLAADGAVWWAEGRAAEGGRTALMRRPAGGEPQEVTPAGANVRTRVHEYGGGAWQLLGPELVVYVDFSDQRVYRLELGGEPVAITPEPEQPAALRYADFELTPDGKTLFCVREVHDGGPEPENEIVALTLDGSMRCEVVAAGRDFYSYPRVSPDGLWLAFTCWDHPNMPWDETELWVTPARDPGAARPLAAGSGESIFAPAWDSQDRLRFVSDRDGWWNLYRTVADFGAPDAAEDLPPVEQLSSERADLGHPQWVFAMQTHVELEDGTLVVIRTEDATERLHALAPGGGALRDLDLPFTSFGAPPLAARGGKVAFVAASPTREPAIFVLDVGSGELETVRDAVDETVDPGLLSEPRAIEFPTSDGDVSHAFYYPPTNADFVGPEDERPPLIVVSHGGPTAHERPALDTEFLFWTSRGFGVVDVNYRGSSGYGRAYREKLKGNWGVVDTEDCVAAARFLAETGEVDGKRLAIRGGSAGGYATLCALVFHDEFAAGASYYGVADAEALARDTHKFEARYLDGLIGPYPERADLYRERSPIHFVERLTAAVILFQGLEDEIVPPNQAETMVAAMAANGIPHAYLAFEGEQHGFRKSETEIRCLEAELYFYGRILGFDPADELQPVEIES
ncbi:MAG TPA: prolyl oligopeptidase family serine peptidase [Solirubrobacterales bacterium]|jgi:dipeptidyl aminopeptidase/acylaminoacyl peptidase|nr:prolyl oligopeptidase family serine peptidase [Solirubrobacterales bacterium]